MSVDTDNNGYVSCAATSAGHPDVAIECVAYLWLSYDSGCKPLRGVLPNGSINVQ